MSKAIHISELKVGMYVNLPTAWHAHPFLKNNFIITSEKQIKRLAHYGIRHIQIDERKGIPAEEAGRQAPLEKDKDFAAGLSLAAEKMQATLADKEMTTEGRVRAVHSHAVDMIKNLWGTPTGEKIAEFKRGVFGVVDMVMTDAEAGSYLVKLASYDYNTYTHSVNVGLLATLLATVLFRKENRHDMYALGAGFFLHDIGKIQIDEALLQKAGALSEEEMALIRKHPGMGFRILNEAKQMGEESRFIVLQHHERHDGTGYPRRLRGEEIHIYGRICSVADVFDALVSQRPYRKACKPFEALKIMKEEMLEHFHKDIFEKFVLLFT